MLFVPFMLEGQIVIGFSEPDSSDQKRDTSAASLSGKSVRMDEDVADYPFIDYKWSTIWNTPADTFSDYCYIRRNFTDQMVSAWTYPNRLYPASRIYGLSMDGKFYKSAKVSPGNFVFAEKKVTGKMNLFIYRKIPQANGWVEFIGFDSLQSGYKNNMIIENKNNWGKREYFGYFISMDDNVLVPVTVSGLKTFADTYLSKTPQAYAMAMKFANQKMTKTKKIAVIGLMSLGMIGLAITGESAASYIFLAGFPAAALVAYLNRPHTLHWEDMVDIVELYNQEIKGISP